LYFQVIEIEKQILFALKRVNLSGFNESAIAECINEVRMLEELKDSKLVIQIKSW
jgi:hypothetical protein